jgi:hypothetical protein
MSAAEYDFILRKSLSSGVGAQETRLGQGF